MDGNDSAPAVAPVAARTATGECAAAASNSPADVNRACIRNPVDGRQHGVAASAPATSTGAGLGRFRANLSTHVNRAGKVDAVANEDHGLAAVATHTAAGTTPAARRASAGPRAAVIDEGLIPDQTRRAAILAGSASNRATQASIDKWNAADDLRALSRDASYRLRTAASTAASSKVAVAGNSAAVVVAAVGNDAPLNAAGAGGTDDERPVAAYIHHGGSGGNAERTKPGFGGHGACPRGAAKAVVAVPQPRQPGRSVHRLTLTRQAHA